MGSAERPPALKPLNSPICPHCGSKRAARMGFVREVRGSLWRCRAEACGRTFALKTFVLKSGGA